jgi:hypothetical protein
MTATPHCARPGCGDPVAAWLTYDYAGRKVWLDDPGAGEGGHSWPLCWSHSERMRVPIGWVCHDRRSGAAVAV